MQIKILRRPTAAEMSAIRGRNGSHSYWLDGMDVLVGHTFEALRPCDVSLVVDTSGYPSTNNQPLPKQCRIPTCVTELIAA